MNSHLLEHGQEKSHCKYDKLVNDQKHLTAIYPTNNNLSENEFTIMLSDYIVIGITSRPGNFRNEHHHTDNSLLFNRLQL